MNRTRPANLLTRGELLLHEAETKWEWERIFNSFTDIVTLQDNSFRILKINDSGCNALNQNGAELVGHSCFELFYGANVPCSDCPFREPKKTFLAYTREIRYETLGKTFLVSGSPVLNEQGELEYILHVAKDISQCKRAEREKLQANLRHAQKLESVGQLAAGIAHEINTPTQYVGSNINFLEESFSDIAELMQVYEQILIAAEQPPVDPQLLSRARNLQKEADWDFLRQEIPAAIRQSKEGIQRVASIVRAMKEFSHPGNKEKEPVNLNTIIETTVTIARNEWKYVAEVETRLEPDLPAIHCLRDEISQVILNILVNAAHAIAEKLGSNPAGDKGTITLATSYNTDWVEICISDTGAGIPKSIRKRIFDPFFTTKKAGKGTGQGLAISHEVITRNHGGTIEVRSELKKGSRFLIRLPRAAY